MIEKNRIVLVSRYACEVEYLRNTLNLSELNAIIVAECSSGLQALSAASEFKPALVIANTYLPDISVEELLKKINPQNGGGAVICFIERGDFEVCRKLFDSGAVACVLKNDSKNYLNERVKNALSIIDGIKNLNETYFGLSGLQYLQEIYLTKLLEGNDEPFIRQRLESLNVAIPKRGAVVVGATLKESAVFESVYARCEQSLKLYNTIGFFWGKRFVFITAITDKKLLKELINDALNSCSNGDICRICVAVSDVFGEMRTLAEAALQAKQATLGDFPSAGYYDCSVSGGKRRKKLVNDALNLICENYTQNISAKWVASKLFVSESYLMHELKADLNKTFTDCLHEYRILKAKELLMQGNMRINEVAAAVGFKNSKYFIRVFKQETGLSPKGYKERSLATKN